MSVARGARIGIIGAKGSGKDTFAAPFIRCGFQRVAFADPMKEMLFAGLGISRETLWGPSEARETIPAGFTVSVRHMLQTLGTGWGRDCVDEDVWIRAALAATVGKEPDGLWIVTDVRFPNEAAALEAAGFMLVRITRPGVSDDAHESESYVSSITAHVEVDNDRTIRELEMAARFVVTGLMHGRLDEKMRLALDPVERFR